MGGERLKIAVLISGRGSNLNALIHACRDPTFPANICLVLSSRSGAEGLEYARDAQIPAVVVDHKAYADRRTFEEAMQREIVKSGADLVVLAGFMRVLTADFVQLWPGRMINIHPSLLPDYKGLNTHARALADGKKEAGCTVHYVVPEMDSGPIIVQKRVPLLSGDTPETLAARVLEQEHLAYPEAVRIVCEDLRRRGNPA
ncbi:MAG: phosphoribosylglycinamide formyltransferase [Alphaproteobacteria bacterium]|nr:phosphoribosylglycinamide formyltransferase [Alphaproteobacteria bacterium]MBP7758995.1 phosphoribosylglycinamide formyltransferase [Alphaproteobacteria bacterium]MBP7762269.1 phosphoribosylglycinamide formyltransferase [Alphaproteobacteria bacterium]MBP7904835.1 phosphoribosylglycinamide formyltransferase [Alphaproteobacteria bacterium]